MQKDNVEDLESLIVQCKNQMSRMIRPLGLSNYKTLIHAAVEYKSINCLALICRKSSIEEINFPDGEGKTALHYAISQAAGENSLTNINIMHVLCSAGASLLRRDIHGNTVLHSLVKLFISDFITEKVLFKLLEILILYGHMTELSSAINFSGVSALDLLRQYEESQTALQNSNSESNNSLVNRFMELCGSHEEHTVSDEEKTVKYILTGDYAKLEKHIENVLSLHSNVNFNWYIGLHPVLHYVVSHLSYGCLEKFLCSSVNPWIPYINSNKIALHDSLEKGHYLSVALLIERLVRTPQLPYSDGINLSFSLLQKVICNSTTTRKWSQEVDHNQSLKLLLKSPLINDVNQRKSYHDPTTVLDLAKFCGNEEAVRLLTKLEGIPSSNGDTSKKNFN